MDFKRSLILLFIISWLATSCTTPETPQTQESIDAQNTRQVAKKTILPVSFNAVSDQPSFASPKILSIPNALLDISHVQRQRAELREGPGIKFRLYDRVLPEGTEVIVLRRHDVWQKVLVLDSGATGWVHYQTLAKAQKNTKRVRIASKHLPAVFSVRAIDRAFDINGLKPKVVQIPKGKQFLALNWQGGKVLVYVAETNSLAWLAEEGVQ